MHACMHAWMNEWMNEWTSERMKSRVWEQQTCPPKIYFNMWSWTVSSDVSIQRRHWQPLALSPFMILLYPPNHWCEWCDVCRLTTTPGSTSPTLFEQWCGFFYVPQEPDKCKCCETGPTVFRPYPRSLESLTVGRCHYKGSTFFLVKDPECWSGRGSNPWPPAQQTGALPTEPTRWRLF